MGRVVIAISKPKENKELELLKVVKKHSKILLEQNLVTDRKSLILKGKNGEILEIFEWESTHAIENAHNNEEVLKIWAEFAKVCTYKTLHNLAEVNEVFADFEVLDL